MYSYGIINIKLERFGYNQIVCKLKKKRFYCQNIKFRTKLVGQLSKYLFMSLLYRFWKMHYVMC
jgi:hypothetical protein